MPKRRLCYFIDTHVIGGAEQYLADLASAMHSRGYDVTVICHDFPDLISFLKQRIPESCALLPCHFPSITRHKAVQAGLSMNRSFKSTFNFLKIPGLLFFYWNTLICLIKIWPLLKKAAPDIFHISAGGYPAGESNRAAILASRLQKIPRRVLTVHNLATKPPISYPERWIDSTVESSVHAITTVSKNCKDALINNRQFSSERIRVIYLGLSPILSGTQGLNDLRADLGVGGNAQIIGSIGALQPRKGHANLIQAFHRISQELPAAHLVIIGGGPVAEELRQLVTSLGLQSRVTLAGYKSNAKRFLACFDLFAFPSISDEGLPYVILEAMQLNLPIVSTKVGGTAEEIIDRESGLLVAPGDISELAKGLKTVLSDAALARQLGKNAKERFDLHFQIKRMCDETEELYL